MPHMKLQALDINLRDLHQTHLAQMVSLIYLYPYMKQKYPKINPYDI